MKNPLTEKECAHAPCQCPAETGSDFCSPQCEKAAGSGETDCNCGHPDCRAEA
ncbi:MAG: hypothetical protein M3209_11675 [Acidobacteriota bacterium]|nr:hypothetical protein [Acidobacteriota bacterium]